MKTPFTKKPFTKKPFADKGKFTGNKSFGDRPARSFGGEGSRGEGNSERTFTPRPDGDRPARSFSPNKSFSDRGSRPSFGGNKSFGDRGPKRFGGGGGGSSFGGNRSFGDRPARSFGGEGSGGESNSERTFTPRPAGDRPFTPRPDGDRPARSFSPNRSFGDRGSRPSFGGNKSFGDRGPKRFGGGGGGSSFGGNKSFGDRPARSFDSNPSAEGTGGEGNSERTFTPRPDGDRPTRSFSPNRSFGDRGSRPSFGGNKSFGDRPARSFGGGGSSFGGNKSFGDRPARSFDSNPSAEGTGGEDNSERTFTPRPDGDRPARSFSPNKSFGDRGSRTSFGGNKSFGDRGPKRFGGGESSGEGRSSGGNRGGQFKPKQHFNPNSNISVEYAISVLAKTGTVDLASLKLNIDDTQAMISKLTLLTKFGIVISKDNNTFNLVTYEIMPGLPQFVIINNLKVITKDNYMVNVKTITNKELGENNFIIVAIKDKFAERDIVVSLTKEKEKIIAKPVLYLDQKNLIAPEAAIKSAPFTDIIGVAKYYDNRFVVIALNYKTHHTIVLSNTPDNLEDGNVIRATLVDEVNADFVEILAQEKDSTKLSQLSVFQYNLPTTFSDAALAEAEAVSEEWSAEGRKDITHLPLVTIDDEDAKDFDDAIWVEKTSDNPLTYKLYVAIADVSSCVLPNSELDKEAKQRGNSVYLPGYVIPMLPHRLSNNLCSLNPNINRGCMLAEITVNRNGEIEGFEFSRALMKSHGRLTYNLFQNAIDNDFTLDKITQPNADHISLNKVSTITQELLDTSIKPIYEVYLLLNEASKRRKGLNIQTKETKVILDKEDNILDIITKTSTVANKIVEEFMVIANVCAAKFFAKHSVANLAIYRVHDKPTPEKLMAFAKILKTFNIYTKIPENPNGDFFNELLKEQEQAGYIGSLNENILRTQAQAIYTTYNIGHYGLALKEYCHFTSPIRRYADLMVHRLINNVLDHNETITYSQANVEDIAAHISKTERVAFFAEMQSKERILAKWLQSRLEEKFEAQISSITRSGIFINLNEINISALIPMRLVSRGYAKYDFKNDTIVNPDNRQVYKIGDKITAKLVEANEYKGLLTFSLLDDSATFSKKKPQIRRAKR